LLHRGEAGSLRRMTKSKYPGAYVMGRLHIVGLLVAGATAAWAASDGALAPALDAKVATIVRETLKTTTVPSASVAIVQNGRIAYAQAFGDAAVGPVKPAQPTMRYSIGSISKQFTAASILLLSEQGKLSLDDPVSRYVPDLTRASEVTIRQLLTHTSGYQDYWPQDYVPPFMLQEISAQQILERWARIPLDFEPGAKWQYSNTNYVIAGLIVEKIAGQPLLTFLQQHVFSPLQMASVVNIDRERLGDTDATGYLRYGIGPLRAAPKEGKGWLFAAGELAMTARDLAQWDAALLGDKLLRAASLQEMTREQLLKNGTSAHYGLGIQIGTIAGHRTWHHGGEVSGFVAENLVLPDDRAAIVVLTNEDNSNAAGAIANKIAPLLFAPPAAAFTDTSARDRAIFDGLQRGKLDRSLFTDNGNSYFTAAAIADFAAGLRPLGAASEFKLANQSLRGGMTTRVYTIKAGGKAMQLVLREMPGGKIEQYQIAAAD
jgi:D-alanyl-D-alanine carboxypeptidase